MWDFYLKMTHASYFDILYVHLNESESVSAPLIHMSLIHIFLSFSISSGLIHPFWRFLMRCSMMGSWWHVQMRSSPASTAPGSTCQKVWDIPDTHTPDKQQFRNVKTHFGWVMMLYNWLKCSSRHVDRKCVCRTFDSSFDCFTESN